MHGKFGPSIELMSDRRVPSHHCMGLYYVHPIPSLSPLPSSPPYLGPQLLQQRGIQLRTTTLGAESVV